MFYVANAIPFSVFSELLWKSTLPGPCLASSAPSTNTFLAQVTDAATGHDVIRFRAGGGQHNGPEEAGWFTGRQFQAIQRFRASE